jgi:glutamyl-tRNA reductase
MLAASPDVQRPTLPAPTLVALVAHARSVPSAIREAFGDRLRILADRPDRVLIRTCHRVELYASWDGGGDLDDLALPFGARRLDDVEAVEHFLSVACGLDSTVFGETQVLHQLRETLDASRATRPLDPILDRLFQAGLHAGREARTHFTGSPRSLADVALDRIEADGAPVRDRSILVVGAGRMARLAAFAAARRGARVRVANRTPAAARSLAAEVHGAEASFANPFPIDDLAGIVVALAGPWPVDSRSLLAAMDGGAVLADLSSPPALPEHVTDSLASRFVSVDAFAADGSGGIDDRIRARVDRVVSQAGAAYCQWLRARGTVPAIRQVVETAESRRQRELEWLRRRLPGLGDDELAVVEQMSHRLVASILHAPLTALSADEAGELEPAARELFGL